MIAKKAPVRLCYQHNSFRFDWFFQKLADKVEMDEVSDEFETWPDQIISYRVTSPLIAEKPLYGCITCSVLIGSS